MMNRKLLAGCLLTAVFAVGPSSAVAAEHKMLVLDASGSMWGQIDGQNKITLARTAVGQVVADWPAQDALGLTVYGHRRKGDCADIETLVPVGPLDRDAFLAIVRDLNPKGMTPVADALVHAAAALRATEQKATVILISDGEETCSADPCAQARALEAQGLDFTAHIIGFDVPNPAHQAQLRCMAEATGGRYLNARDARELAAGLKTLGRDEAPLPPAEATVSGPATAVAATSLSVSYSGPASPGDWVGVVAADADPLSYLVERGTWVSAESASAELKLVAPATPGNYELRYVSPARTQAILARTPIVVSPAVSAVRGPATAMASDSILIEAEGPVADDHWIGFAPKGGDAMAYVNGSYLRPDPSGRTVSRLKVPDDAGEYELRYVLKEGAEVIGTQSITVTPAVGRIFDAPAQVATGQTLILRFEGPRNPSGDSWIGFVPSGAGTDAYQTYSYLPEQGGISVQAPTEAGAYDLVYVVAGDRVLARVAVTVTP
ncbi:MAG: VWA domain-containing protein [Ahniella sp.]|nr:VWA domain-containing protein [Ahniella sp.]